MFKNKKGEYPSGLRDSIAIRGPQGFAGSNPASLTQIRKHPLFLNLTLKDNSLEDLGDPFLNNGDPYKHFLSILNSDEILFQYDERPMGRDMLKEIIYTAIYSSETRQEANVNRKLRFMKRKYNHDTLRILFPKFFGALTALRSKTDLPLHMVVNREESRYAQAVLEKGCLEDRVPILPIHDSFITTVENIDKLGQIMDDTSENLYGRRLKFKRKY